MRTLLKSVGIFLGLAIAIPAFAQVSFNITIGAPPPPPREVVVAAPYAGAVWVPGFYRFDVPLNRYIWVPGLWQRPPSAGMIWVEPRYAHRSGRYGFVSGHWAAPGTVRTHRVRPYGRGGAVMQGNAVGRGNGQQGGAIRNGRAPMGQ